jgi:ADP-sugar diphosphatase
MSGADAAPRTLLIHGEEVPLTAEPGIDLDKVMNWGTFTTWVAGIDAKFLIEKIHMQSVDMFGPNIGFMKFRADCFDRATHTFLPGIVFMRGGSVGILTILVAQETGEEFTLAVAQPRLPMGSFESLEIPAGMLDGSGNFAGKAASEMAEETGIIVKEADLLDLTEMVQGGAGHKGIWLSPGGSDEYMRFFVYRKSWPTADIEALEGKLTGLRDSGELITLRVIQYPNLICAPDGKTLCAIALYDRVKDQLPPPEPKEAVPPTMIAD